MNSGDKAILGIVIATACLLAAASLASAHRNRCGFPTLVDVFLLMMFLYHCIGEAVLFVFGRENSYYADIASIDHLIEWSCLVGASALNISIGATLAGFLIRASHLKPAAKSQPIFAWNNSLTFLAVSIFVGWFGLLFIRFNLSAEQRNWFMSLLAQLLPAMILVASIELSIKYGHVARTGLLSILLLLVFDSRMLVGAFCIIFASVLNRLRGFRMGLAFNFLISCFIILILILLIRPIVRSGTNDENWIEKFRQYQSSESSEFSGSTIKSWSLRIDGNSFGTAIAARQETGFDSIGPEVLIHTIKSLVPSVIWPEKLDRPLVERNQEEFLIAHYGLPSADYIPTLLGSTLAIGGLSFTLLAAMVTGLVIGAFDLIVDLRKPLSRACWILGCFIIIVAYEGTVESVILLAGLMLVIYLFLAFAFYRGTHHLSICPREART